MLTDKPLLRRANDYLLVSIQLYYSIILTFRFTKHYRSILPDVPFGLDKLLLHLKYPRGTLLHNARSSFSVGNPAFALLYAGIDARRVDSSFACASAYY